jgi:hypothetical protein
VKDIKLHAFLRQWQRARSTAGLRDFIAPAPARI